MKTRNYHMDLVLTETRNKEVFFNENLGTLDSFMIQSVAAFIDVPPADTRTNNKFIIKSGEKINQICFSTFDGKPWRYLIPKLGMCLYCLERSCLVYFDGANWVDKLGVSEVGVKFEGGEGDFPIANDITYVYLNGHTKILLKPLFKIKIEIIFKQNHASVYNVEFDSPILWKGGVAYNSPREPNLIDHIRLTKLPESDHYLGEIVNTGYRY